MTKDKKYILVIVESPGRINKIQSILGPNSLVAASYGHIIDLPVKSISVDLKTFVPEYVNVERQLKVIQDLKTKAKNASSILLAADEDREGEMIAWSVAYILNILSSKTPNRIVFNSITNEEITKAVKNPRFLDYNLIDAQKARRILDRIVGYELSPILWAQLKQRDLSAGRVQSVVVKIIVEREQEIKDFLSKKDESFFKFKGVFTDSNKSNKLTLTCNLHDLVKVNKSIFSGVVTNIATVEESRKFLNKCINSTFKISSITDKKSFSNPSAPFTTSTLQQEGFRKLGFSVQRTMQTAQKLYEAGHITYMRTDSSNLSKEALVAIKDYILESYDESYYKSATYDSKTGNAQEAHEAVRPSNIKVKTLDDQTNQASNDSIKLYNLIWKRAVASQMSPAEYNITQIQISISKDSKHYFETSVEKLMFPGYLKVYDVPDLEEDNNTSNSISKNVKIPDTDSLLNLESITGKQEYSKPPSRYNEGSLTKKLDPDNLNIGRPATTASIITKIQDRGYVAITNIPGIEKDSLILTLKDSKIVEKGEKVLIGKESNKFIPLSLGIIVNDLLQSNFPKILDYKFTADLEESLDKIASGEVKYVKILDKFYKEFHPLVEKFKNKKSIVDEKYTRIVGKYLDTDCDIVATIGPKGPYIKLVGDNDICKEKGGAPIKPPLTIENITVKDCVDLLKYPVNLGDYLNKPVLLKTGEYGFYISYNKSNYTVNLESLNIKDISSFTLKDGISVIDKVKSKQLKEIKDSKNKKTYIILDGEYGPYISIKDLNKTKKSKKNVNVSIPKDVKIDSLDLDKILEIITKHYENKKNKWKKKDGAESKSKISRVTKKDEKDKSNEENNMINYASDKSKESKESKDKTKVVKQAKAVKVKKK